MNQDQKFRLEQQTKRRYWLLRLPAGCTAVFRDKAKRYILAGYLALAASLWLFRGPIFKLDSGDVFAAMNRMGIENLLRFGAIAGGVLLLLLFGMPLGGKAIHDNLRRIGFVNHAGETPLLVAAYPDKDSPHVEILEFEANGIPLMDWSNKQEKLEAALDVYAVKIKEGKNKRRILLYTVPAGDGLPEVLYWKEEYLNRDSFVLLLGESLTGPVSVNLTKIPHILVGGSTGSGKSVLLKLLLMQCVQKGAWVYIADFKGGVDYPRVWHNRCHMVTTKETLLHMLERIVYELEIRKELFSRAECSNLDEYNRKTGSMHPRIIVACDEVAEVLDKTGLEKSEKEQVAQIENKLSVIARQGRAFGIHLILATQRPDANILSGQIRNNIDCRACGHADNVLSQIILDNTDASSRIPKDVQGRFLLHDGTVFQGYLFDEEKAFGGGADGV